MKLIITKQYYIFLNFFLLFVSGSYCQGQGFANIPINWPTPPGGLFDAFNNPLGFPYPSNTVHAGNNSTQWNTIDMNGNGKADLVVTSDYSTGNFIQFGVPGAPFWKVYEGNGTGFSSSFLSWTTPVGGQYSLVNGNYGYLNINGLSNQESISQTWQLIDMNNDQLPDLVVTAAYNGSAGWPVQFGVGNSPHWKVYLNTGSSFATTPIVWSTPAGGAFSSSGTALGFFDITGSCSTNNNCQYWQLMDLNGDRLPDLVITAQYNATLNAHIQFGAGSSPYFKVYLNNGAGFNNTPLNWSTPIGGRYLTNTNSLGYTYSYGIASTCDSSQSWAIADADGDFLPDLIVTAHFDLTSNLAFQFGTGLNPHWRIFKNTGNGFDTIPVLWPTPSGGWYSANGQLNGYNFPQSFGYIYNQGCEQWTSKDLDGDDRPEFIVMSVYSTAIGSYQQYGVGTAPYWKVYHNTGSGFSPTPVIWSTPAGGMINSSNANLGFNLDFTWQLNVQGSEGWKLMDMNGDKMPDLTVFSAWNSALSYPVQFGVPGSPRWNVFLNTTTPLSSASITSAHTNVVAYPNPSTHLLYLKSDQPIINSTYTIYSIEGRLLETGVIMSEVQALDISHLSRGLYFIGISGEVNSRIRFLRD